MLCQPDTLDTEESTFQCLVHCYYSEFPISELGEYFRPLTGCIDVMSSSAVTAASGDLFLWVGGAEVCVAAIHPRGRHKPERVHSAVCALVLTADLWTRRGKGTDSPLLCDSVVFRQCSFLHYS